MGPSEIGQVMGRMKNESDEREREAPDETRNESRAQEPMGVSSFVIRVSPTCSRSALFCSPSENSEEECGSGRRSRLFRGGGLFRWLVLGANMARKTQTPLLHSSPSYRTVPSKGGSGWYVPNYLMASRGAPSAPTRRSGTHSRGTCTRWLWPRTFAPWIAHAPWPAAERPRVD